MGEVKMHIVDTCEPVQPLSAIAGMHRDHLARLQRIKVKAIGQKAIEVAALDNDQVDILEKRWAERQKAAWFEIISEKAAPGGVIKIDDILRVCCKYFDLTNSQIKSARRTAPVVYARQIAMYLCKYRTTKSYPEIGRRLGGRDHTTVLHGHKKIEANLLKDASLAYDVAHVEAML
jgi:chromosomal replication initiation ATPase DnaA